jgi:hypothetical protein
MKTITAETPAWPGRLSTSYGHDLVGVATEIVEAYVEVTIACEDDKVRDPLVSASKGYGP